VAALDADVCVIGAGIAGLAIAAELERAGIDTVVLEAARRVGGAGNAWYGRLALYDPLDFEERPWVPLSGWPIARAEVLERVPRAARFLGLEGSDRLDPAAWADDPAVERLSGDGLAVGVFLWARRPWRPAKPARLVLRAPVRRLLSEGDTARIAAAEIVGGLRVAAGSFVLACGAAGNAELLRASGIGGDSVGRYAMDHPRVEGVARVQLPTGASPRALLEHTDPRAEGAVQFFVRPSDELQRRERLLNCCSFLYPESGVRAAARRARRWPRPVDRLVAVDQVEQVPDRESRVGDWRAGDAPARTLHRVHDLLADRFRETGAGTVERRRLPAFGGADHPMGTTRMSTDPRTGVVDAECRVHGVANLHVAGGSVFPTGGAAPPTLTIVCLALRVADRLAGAGIA
jgi:choline dehydrogenase-like flavoprotein